MTTWLTIIGMALVTYLTRAPLLLVQTKLSPSVARWLSYVPAAVFTALILPALLVQRTASGPALVFGPPLLAGIVGALVAWRGGNVLVTILAGLVTFWLVRGVW